MIGRYDGVLIDLDGVVYRGDQALPGAAGAWNRFVAKGSRCSS